METIKKNNSEKCKDVQRLSLAIAEAMAEIKPENQVELEIILASGVTGYLVEWMKFQKFEKDDIEMSVWCLGRTIAQCSDNLLEFYDFDENSN